jgi:hypothetical protein
LFAGHLINEDGWQALMSDDYESFLDARAADFRSRVKARFAVPAVVAAEDEDEVALSPAGSEESIVPE